MDTESLRYCEFTLEQVKKKIFDIEVELLPVNKERELKKELKRLKIIEGHLIGEVTKLRQLSLFEASDGNPQ